MRGFLSDILSAPKAKQEPEDICKGREVPLSEKIDELGFGAYQMQVWLLCSGFIVAEGAEVQMASGLVSAMQEEFEIVSHFGKAMLMVWTFIGFALGTMTSGPLADSLGRRNPMIIGYCGIILTASVTTLATDVTLVYGFRLILGFFAGVGIPTAVISISEVTPSTMRGRATAALGIAYILGELWASAGLLILMPDLVHGSWRLLIGWALIPAVCMVTLGMLSPVTRHDTPYFVGCQGKSSELRQLLNLVADMNGKPDLKLADQDTVTCQVPQHIPIADVLPTLFRSPTNTTVMVMCFMMFAKDLCYYGTNVFWPQIWAQVSSLGKMNPAQELVATAFLGIPGVLLAMVLMNSLPRKVGVYFCALACSVCVLFLRGLSNGRLYSFVGVIGWKILFPTWQMTTMLLPSELFGTRIRGWAFSFAAAWGRLATIIAPFAVEMGTDGFTALLFMIAIGAVFCGSLLPETKDCELVEDLVSDPSRRQISSRSIDVPSDTYGTVAKAAV